MNTRINGFFKINYLFKLDILETYICLIQVQCNKFVFNIFILLLINSFFYTT